MGTIGTMSASSTPAGTVDLWYVSTGDVIKPSLLRACTALLTPVEAEKHQAFIFEKHRHEYLVTRALARGVLARYAGKAPALLDFERNEYGRPALVPPSVRFNLSNSTKLVVCAVARDRELGVDTEPLDRGDRILDIAESFFTPRERAQLGALGPSARARRAVTLWTLKEAYMKARGMGMSIPALDFELIFDGSQARLGLHPPLVDATPWIFDTLELEGHLVSTCIERGATVETHRADLEELLG